MRRETMKGLLVVILICFIVLVGIAGTEHMQVISLTRKATKLENLKAHFYDFRERIYLTVPVDYLSEVTLGDFDFDKYLEDE